ncbi:actin-related protein 6 [Anthonomus grandis grandis]|uniref:actin-related protein 6 n=1 Tax=Anthonomus grandis grandis TaxID=2921223 RepID=UPI002164F0C3|nr:actin-related protein 6 [Anthonomus grandis grandis]
MNDWEIKQPRIKRRRSSGTRDVPINPKPPKVPSLKALIVDNGAYSIKIGYSKDEEPRVIPNCIMKAKSERKRLFIGQQIQECRDCSGLYFLLPCERGYITRWEVQKPVWDNIFSKNVCPIEENPVVITQPLFNFKSIQDCTDEIFFEEYEVPSLFRCHPADLAYLNYAKEHKLNKTNPCLVIDSGYSFTHIVPYIKGNKFLRAIKRVNVGGKLLTNHLKDIISYRQYNVMEETYVINQVKEDTCYVCKDIKQELAEAAKPSSSNSIVKNYVLPDFNVIRRGFIQELNKDGPKSELEESYQILRLNNERFVVPEILFHPSDIGMKSMGIAEAAVKSIFSCPKEHRELLANHIILVGGNCKFPGFKERMYAELRSLLPDSWEVNIFQHEDPLTYAWKGGSALLRTHDFKSNLVTKQDYDELGSSIIQERFNCFMLDDRELEQDNKKPMEQTYQYLPNLKSCGIFGKFEPQPNTEESKLDIEEQSCGRGEGNKEDNGEDITQEIEEEKTTRRGPGRMKKGFEEELFMPDVFKEDDEEQDFDLTQNSQLFPFGTMSYL